MIASRSQQELSTSAAVLGVQAATEVGWHRTDSKLSRRHPAVLTQGLIPLTQCCRNFPEVCILSAILQSDG